MAPWPTSTRGTTTATAPAALFLHGVLANADLWRNVIWDVADLRRCIAPDLPAHGATPVPADAAADLSLHGLAAMLDELCGRLGLEQVDLVANDTGGAVAQVFAARYPERIRTLTLTNCDVHDNFPPEAFRPFVELAESGEFGPMVAAMAEDPELARSEVGFGMGYARPDQLPDEILDSFLGPFVADQGRGLERVLTASSASELMAVEPGLAAVAGPHPGGVGDRRLVLRGVVGAAPGRHDSRRRARRAHSRRHAVLARRAGCRPGSAPA